MSVRPILASFSAAVLKPRNEREWRVLRTFKSRSSPNVRHQVRLAGDGQTTYCTCPGFCFHKKCWHHDSVICS